MQTIIKYTVNAVLFILLFPVSVTLAQQETGRWEKQVVSYELPAPERERPYGINADSAIDFLLQGAANFYWIAVSDVDGDNCPFEPSCSHFLIKAVRNQGIVTGGLMFADRFLRDINFVNRQDYPIHPNGHLHDPPSRYAPPDEFSEESSGRAIR